MQEHARRARRAALDVLVRVDRDRAFADRVLDTVLRRGRLSGRDKGLVTELVYGTLRHRIYIDFILGRLSARPLRKTHVETRNALRMGAHQLLHMRVPTHAAVNETVSLVRQKHRAASGYVNALLRKISTLAEHRELPTPDDNDPLTSLSVVGSHPHWLLDELATRLGLEEVQSFVEANNQTPPLQLRVNSNRSNRETLAGTLRESGLEVEAPDSIPHALEVRDAGLVTDLEDFQLGLCSVQDFAAQWVGLLSAPTPGMTVLDACAAPGGKTCHLAEMMGDEGRVIALDVHPGRTGLIASNAKRLGLSSIETHALDASDPSALSDALADASGIDLVLLDAPCSGLGTLRRHPELRLRKQGELHELVRLQLALLDSVASQVKIGGHLVYSVCTVTRQEGLDQVKAFLGRHSEFEPDWPTLPSLESVKTMYGELPVMESWPHRHGADGFFAARFRRTV